MPIGRPREFDTEQALDRALKVFWQKGYEGASLADLTKAMGINRPSLYAAFGNKEALFRKALDRYADGPAAYIDEALAQPSVREVVAHTLRGAIRLLTDPRNPRGCLAVHGALACGKEAEGIRQELMLRRDANETALRRRFQRARAEGDLSAGFEPATLAAYVATVTYGLAVQAAGGASRKELERVAELAMKPLGAGRKPKKRRVAGAARGAR